MEQTTLSARHQLQCDHATTVPHARAPRGRCAPSGTGRTGVVYAFPLRGWRPRKDWGNYSGLRREVFAPVGAFSYQAALG
jgi:hypothetical protein